MTELRTGKCLCGAVRYSVDLESTDLRVCHCSMCRRFSGGIEIALDAARDQVTFSAKKTSRCLVHPIGPNVGFASIVALAFFGA